MAVYGLKKKIGLAFAILTVLTMLLLTIALYWSFRLELRESTRNNLRHIVDLATLILNTGDHAMLKNRTDIGTPAYARVRSNFQRILKKAPNTTYIYTMRQRKTGEIEFIIVVGNDHTPTATTGLLLGDAYANPEPSVAKVFSSFSTPLIATDFNTDTWGTWLSGFAPIIAPDGSRDGVLGVDIAASDVLKREHRVFWVSITVFLIIAPLSSFLGWIVGCRVAAPIILLTEGANRISKGDFNHRVKIERNDEIFELATAFNNMTDKLSCTLSDLKKEIDMRTQAEEEVRKFNLELEDRVRTRTKELEIAKKELETFTYTVAHDLRAPLRTMQNFSKILLEDCSKILGEQEKEYLGYLVEGSHEMDELIKGLLTLAHSTRKKVELQKVNLSEMVKSAIDFHKETEPSRQLTVKLTENIEAMADPTLIKIVIDNLIGNAWKYTGKNTKTYIEFGTEHNEEKTIYYIKDNGVGFDMSFAHKIFLPFHRLHEYDDFQGSGIGLATVQWLIQKHGGDVWASSKINKGSIFYLTLE